MIPRRPRATPAVTLICAALVSWATPADAGRGKALPDWAMEATTRSPSGSGGDFHLLHRELIVRPMPEGGVRVQQRLAGRILSVAGMETLSSHAVGYRRGDGIPVLQAWSQAPGGSVRQSERRKDVTDMAATDGFSVYDDGRIRQVGAPGAAVGAFVAFESVVERRFDPGAHAFTFGEPDHPVAWSRFVLDVPEGLSWEVVKRRIDDAPGFDEQRSPAGIVLTALDLKPLPRETYRPVAQQVLPTVWARWWDDSGARGFRTWDDVGTWYRALADPVLAEPGEAQALGEGLRPAAADSFLDALAGAFDFAARTVRYVSIQIGVGGYRPYSPAVVCKNRFGDCKDKTFLMRALVGSWETRSFPILVRTDDLGDVDPDVPSPAQFNHCVVAVLLPDGVGETLWNTIQVEGIGRLAVLDPTARQLGPWDLPTTDQGTLGLLVHDAGGRLVRLPNQPPASSTASRRLSATLGADGLLTTGTLTESWTGTAAGAVRSYYAGKRPDEHRRDADADLGGRFPGMRIMDYRVEGLDRPGLDILERSEIVGGRSGRRVGTLLIVEPGKLARGLFDALPTGTRRWPLRAGQPREETVEVSLQAPAGWVPEGLPEGVEVRGEDLVAEATWSMEDGRLVYRRSARLLSPVVPPERYATFQQQVARIERADREGIVLIPAIPGAR